MSSFVVAYHELSHLLFANNSGKEEELYELCTLFAGSHEVRECHEVETHMREWAVESIFSSLFLFLACVDFGILEGNEGIYTICRRESHRLALMGVK